MCLTPNDPWKRSIDLDLENRNSMELSQFQDQKSSEPISRSRGACETQILSKEKHATYLSSESERKGSGFSDNTDKCI